MSTLILRTGHEMPMVGLGFWKVPNALTAELAVASVQLGYRHFDCACDYGNEAEVGEGLQQIFSTGLARREEMWITSKLWNTYHRPEHVRPALEKSLRDLQLDTLDLYLIHFPIPLKFVSFEKRYPPGWLHDPEAESPRMEPDAVPLLKTWQAMEELVDAGLVRDLGVCNVGVAPLRELLYGARIPPAMLQVELHPLLTQEKLIRFCHAQEIQVTAFSPLAAQSYFSLDMAELKESVLTNPAVWEIAKAHNRTPAQILLRWGIQRGTAVVPKTVNLDRLKENLELFDFQLEAEEMNAISALNINRRFNDPGEFCEKAFHTFFPIFE